MSSHSVSTGLGDTLADTTFLAYAQPFDRYDVVIRFLSAKNLPKMDTIGRGDPYFIARIDDQVTYTSSILHNTSTPQWDDEEWIVRNIPRDAKLAVVLFDKDDEKLVDDHIGRFEVLNLINYHPPTGGHEILGLYGHNKGYFHLSVFSMESSEESQQLPKYTFDGPCRYFRHDSFAVGRLTMLNADCVYSTWKIDMKRISVFFLPHKRQHWNREYQAAQTIFGNGLLSQASRDSIKLAHKVLYGRTMKHSETGRLNGADDLWKLVFAHKSIQKIRLCIYTYVIDENKWKFSETGHQIFTNLASKHALLANGSEHVRYAGEFHPRPKYGWDRCDDEWELVFDNGSGTYAPTADLLENLKELLLYNFPGLNVVTYDYKDPELKASMGQLKLAIEKDKHFTPTLNRLVSRVQSSTPTDDVDDTSV